jgi:hypothetical protein
LIDVFGHFEAFVVIVGIVVIEAAVAVAVGFVFLVAAAFAEKKGRRNNLETNALFEFKIYNEQIIFFSIIIFKSY